VKRSSRATVNLFRSQSNRLRSIEQSIGEIRAKLVELVQQSERDEEAVRQMGSDARAASREVKAFRREIESLSREFAETKGVVARLDGRGRRGEPA
jgi:chromosome segregation ATPase